MSIRFEHLAFSYDEGGKEILADFSAEFTKEKITILTGASGCGKSTLLYLAAGLYPHNGGFLKGGSVTIDGVKAEDMKPKERCQMVGMMFQNPELQFCMDTVKNELIFCLENIECDPADMDQRMDEALAFCEIPHLKDRKLVTLSGGERQKVMLACVYMLRPQWMLLDEPFANIDNHSAEMIVRKLQELHVKYGVGILAVDHRLDNWLAVADEVRIMEKGQLLGEPMQVNALDQAVLEEHGIIVPGVSYRPEIAAANPGDTVLELSHVAMKYGDHEVLTDVTASFQKGMIYAIEGESGCGKSSLFGALSGLYKYRGKILFEGQDVKRLKKTQSGHMGFVTQNPTDQFVGGNIRQEITISLKGNPEAERISEEILRNIKLWRYREVSPYLLSQGQQRRLGVAALMAYDCHVLVCDEPTYAQDRRNTMAIMDALVKQAREAGAAVIFSTHDPQLARDYADVVYRLEGGVLYENHESIH